MNCRRSSVMNCMKMTPSLFCLSSLIIVSIMIESGMTQTNLQTQATGNMNCPAKIGECDYFKAPESEKDNVVKTCCGLRGWERCAKKKVADFCPDTKWDSIARQNPDLDSAKCSQYSFWTPECIWNNYMYETIGAAAGAAGILIILILICCCCCCRGKKD